MTDARQREVARQFFYKWKGKGKEDEDARSYWIEILQNILGISDVTDRTVFEKKVVGGDGNTKRIDVYIPETQVLIEQKSYGIALDKPQSGHNGMTPYEQAKMYDNYLPFDERARWIVTSNFAEIWIYDRNQSRPDPLKLSLSDFPSKYHILSDDEKQKLLKADPKAEKWIRPFITAREYINGISDARVLYPDASLADLYDDMRTFYEEWKILDFAGQSEQISEKVSANLELTNSESEETVILPIWNLQVPYYQDFPMDEFLHVGFTHHRVILGKVKSTEERLFYIRRCANEHLTVEALKNSLAADDYHQGSLPNNFMQTLPAAEQAFRAINTFKDEYLLDYINVEELGVRDKQDVDERVVENAIIHNIKNFILTFGKDFAFVRNQYHLDAFGEDQYIDLLFFNRELNCLVAVELKRGKFKTSYLGQLQGYLSVLDGFERKPHENPSIGLILCKDMNKSFVDYVIQDYARPMGVATYKTSRDMSEELRKALPDVEELRKLLDDQEL